ncbi:MAG TPA: PLP-dependent aminotransferase family protein, partial [Dehalococcoidia bacterium]|nr:PLP-dependent aminotransferase family protein [Dehalococcoidia bacterium]
FCATFLNPGDIVLVEGPSFPGTVETILKYQGKIIEVPITPEGMSYQAIEEIVAKCGRSGEVIKGIYTIDDFHNPTGITMSENNRLMIGQLALENGIMILEDSTYSGLFFEIAPPLDMYSMNGGQGVLRMGTFSKTIATGLRLGWLQGSSEAIDAIKKTRSDMGNAPFIQTAVSRFIESSEYSSHVKEMRSLYRSQCKALTNSLTQHCSNYLEFIEPRGGFFLWPKCIGVDSAALTKSAAEEGVIFPDGSLFYQDPSLHENHIRLAFSGNSPERLGEVGLRLRKAFEKLLD